jgi:hypothetical protein
VAVILVHFPGLRLGRSLTPPSRGNPDSPSETKRGKRLEICLPGSAFGDHDLLSTAKISNVLYAREDAKTTNAGALGAKAGGRRRTSFAGCLQAGYQGSIEAYAQSGSESVKALPAAHRPVAWKDRINRTHSPVIFCRF